MNIIMGANMPNKDPNNKTPLKGQKGYAGIDIHETYQQNQRITDEMAMKDMIEVKTTKNLHKLGKQTIN